MYYELDISLRGKICVGIIGLFLIVFIIWLVYKRKLSENLALLWIFTTLIGVFLVNFESLLFIAAKLSGIKTGALAIAMMAFVFVFAALIIFSVKLTSLTNKLRRLTQHVALMDIKEKSKLASE